MVNTSLSLLTFANGPPFYCCGSPTPHSANLESAFSSVEMIIKWMVQNVGTSWTLEKKKVKENRKKTGSHKDVYDAFSLHRTALFNILLSSQESKSQFELNNCCTGAEMSDV